MRASRSSTSSPTRSKRGCSHTCQVKACSFILSASAERGENERDRYVHTCRVACAPAHSLEVLCATAKATAYGGLGGAHTLRGARRTVACVCSSIRRPAHSVRVLPHELESRAMRYYAYATFSSGAITTRTRMPSASRTSSAAATASIVARRAPPALSAACTWRSATLQKKKNSLRSQLQVYAGPSASSECI